MFDNSRFRWIVAISIIGILFLLSLPSMLMHGSFRKRVIGGVLAREGIDFRVEEVRAGWFRPVRVEALSIGPVGKPSLLLVDEIRSDRTFLSAMWQGVDEGLLTVHRPQIHIWDDDSGSNLSFPQLEQRIEELAKQQSQQDDVELEDQPSELDADATQTVGTSASKSLRIEIAEAELWLKTKPMEREELVFQGLYFVGSVNKSATGQNLLVIEPRRMLDRSVVTTELCKGLLKYFVPVLADAAWVEGEFSLELDQSTIDLDQPENTRLSGRLFIHGVQAGVHNEIITAAADRLAGVFGGTGFDTIRFMDNAEISFEVRDGRVWHEGLEFGLPKVSPDLVVQTSGSVSFQDEVDITIDIPLPLHLLSDGPVADAIRDTSLQLAVTGTLKEPQVEMADQDFVTDLISTIGNRLSEEEQPLQSMLQGIRGAIRGNEEQPADATPVLQRIRELREKRKSRPLRRFLGDGN